MSRLFLLRCRRITRKAKFHKSSTIKFSFECGFISFCSSMQIARDTVFWKKPLHVRRPPRSFASWWFHNRSAVFPRSPMYEVPCWPRCVRQCPDSPGRRSLGDDFYCFGRACAAVIHTISWCLWRLASSSAASSPRYFSTSVRILAFNL